MAAKMLCKDEAAWERELGAENSRNDETGIDADVLMKVSASSCTGRSAFTLVEVAICLAIMGLVFAGILLGNTQSTNRAEWSGYSLAAQAQAVQRVELSRAASWDTQALPPIDQIPSIAGTNVAVLDIPISGTNM